MTTYVEEIADALARDVLRAVGETGNEELVAEIAKMVGATSTTTQEAFLTAVRVRMAEGRARRFLAQRVGADWPLQASAQPAAAGAPAAPTNWAAAILSMPEKEGREDDLPVMGGEEAKPKATERPAEVVAAPAVPVVTAEQAEPEAEDDGRIRPRHHVPSAKPAPASKPTAPQSLEAALALAASMPRKAVPQASPQAALPTPYDDIEMPDVDWG